MDTDAREKSDRPAKGNAQRTNADDTGLSFEAEPTGVEGSPDQGGKRGSDPGRSSSLAALTPGPPADVHHPFWTPTTAILVAVLLALIVAAVWLL